MKTFRLILSSLFVLYAALLIGCTKEQYVGNRSDKPAEVTTDFKEKMITDYISGIGIDAFMVSVNGKEIIHFESEAAAETLTYAQYNKNPYGNIYNNGFFTMSAVKSWTAIILGTLIDNGLIKDTNVPVTEFIPEWAAGTGITLHHLLTMTSGIENLNPDDGVIYRKDKNAFVLSLSPDTKPGEKWSYSNEAVQILGIFIERVAGQSLAQYSNDVLFTPLEMTHTAMWMDENGQTKAYADAITSIEDFHKIGQLLINKGKWNGKQIISESWISRMLKTYRQDGVQSYGFSGYGYLCWIDSYQEQDAFIFSGQQNSKCIMLPESGIVISMLQKTIPESGFQSVSMPFLIKSVLELIEELENESL